jgi:hypothetical protein
MIWNQYTYSFPDSIIISYRDFKQGQLTLWEIGVVFVINFKGIVKENYVSFL